MNFSAATLERIYDYTARRLVCPVEILTSGETHVITAMPPDDDNFMRSTALRKPDAICVTQLSSAAILRANAQPTAAVQCFLQHVKKAHPFDPAAAARSAGVHLQADAAEPYFYLNAEDFRPTQEASVRQLSGADAPLLAELHAAIPQNMRWFVGIDHPIIFGCFTDDGTLAAVASHFLFEAERIAAGGVLTHPDYRRHGYGRAATSAIMAWAIEREWVCEWSTWAGNNGSYNIATSLGFTHFLTETDYVVSA